MANKSRASEKESYWRLALEEFQGSGLSVRAFCRREGLSEPSFFTWRRTLQERDAAKLEAHREIKQPHFCKTFLASRFSRSRC